jgi:hypothetical protein
VTGMSYGVKFGAAARAGVVSRCPGNASLTRSARSAPFARSGNKVEATQKHTLRESRASVDTACLASRSA